MDQRKLRPDQAGPAVTAFPLAPLGHLKWTAHSHKEHGELVERGYCFFQHLKVKNDIVHDKMIVPSSIVHAHARASACCVQGVGVVVELAWLVSLNAISSLKSGKTTVTLFPCAVREVVEMISVPDLVL